MICSGCRSPPWIMRPSSISALAVLPASIASVKSHGGERHPLQIMAILHTHYGRLARLDGVDATNENEAAEAMGIKPGFPAKKALGNYRRLGGGGVQRAIELLARADLDLRGDTDLDSEMVIEVLVARLSRLGSRR